MATISDETLEFARDSFRWLLMDVLDDPFSLVEPDREREPREAFARFRRLAADLGLDYEEILNEAHEYERKRLAQIESGEILPMARLLERGSSDGIA